MMVNTPISCEVLLADLDGALQQGLTKEMLLYNLNTQTPTSIKDALYSIFCAKKHEIGHVTERCGERLSPSSLGVLELVERASNQQLCRQAPLGEVLVVLVVDSSYTMRQVMAQGQKAAGKIARMTEMMAEGITAVGLHSIFSTDAQTQFEYDHNFARLREYFYTESKYCDDEQSLFRPISQQDYSTVLQSLNNKFAEIRTHLKLTTCQRALILRSRLMEGRRKRRNFPKETTKILNEYFYANYTQQYPTEEVKAVLAKQCNMTIAQVSNWFGNKRIRHNKYKNTAKGQKEMEMYTGKQLPSTGFTLYISLL
uniref:Homeobox domain-containing protein n=1 Tax=Ditylenchus dipsaci TaxID=166011 RepID=A0A915EFQ8_9BILA